MVQLHNQPCQKPVKIMERSLLSARYCFVENLINTGKMEESEYLVLSEWFNFFITCPQLDFHVDQIIYLRTDPEVAHDRLKKRDRVEEHSVPLQYLKGITKPTKSYIFIKKYLISDLHELHEDWLV